MAIKFHLDILKESVLMSSCCRVSEQTFTQNSVYLKTGSVIVGIVLDRSTKIKSITQFITDVLGNLFHHFTISIVLISRLQ